MEAIQVLMFIVISMLPDGEFDSKLRLVDQCPSHEFVHNMMESELKSGKIVAWSAKCETLQFLRLKPNNI